MLHRVNNVSILLLLLSSIHIVLLSWVKYNPDHIMSFVSLVHTYAATMAFIMFFGYGILHLYLTIVIYQLIDNNNNHEYKRYRFIMLNMSKFHLIITLILVVLLIGKLFM